MSSLSDFVIENGILKKYTGPGGDVVIPEGVTAIGDFAFSERKDLTAVTIPGTVTSIGALSFSCCEGLTSVTIPENVTSIGSYAFSQCRNLTRVMLPGSLTKIEQDAFPYCPLTWFEIPAESPLKIGKIFGYFFPSGLGEQLDELSRRMDAAAVKEYIMPDQWKLLSEDSRARIYLTCQDAAMKKYYKKLLKPADFDSLSAAILARLGKKLSKKECATLADFMTANVAYLSGSALKTMYDTVREQKAGKDAIAALDASAAVKKKLSSAPAQTAPRANPGPRTKNDVAFDNMGFDDNGVKVYNLGDKEVHAVIQPDMQVMILDPKTGKTAKSVPKRGADPELYTAAAEDFKALSKGVKALYNTCRDSLFNLYLEGAALPPDSWKLEWTGNPITRMLSSMVVWQQGEACLILEGRQSVTVDGSAYALTAEPVRVAHTAELSRETVTAWQRYFAAHNRKQPFLQIWEPVRREADICPDRYKGVPIRTGYLRNQRTLGVEASFYADWESDRSICALSLKNFDIDVQHSDQEPELEIQRIVPVKWDRRSNAIISFLDRITVYGRIHRDDDTVVEILDQFTLEQITDFIGMALKHSCTGVTAALLAYKETHFADFDPMEEFTLDL